MTTVNRKLVLQSLIEHETLRMSDILKDPNLGEQPDEQHILYLLIELEEENYIKKLNGVDPIAYTITHKGIEEGRRHDLLVQDKKIH